MKPYHSLVQAQILSGSPLNSAWNSSDSRCAPYNPVSIMTGAWLRSWGATSTYLADNETTIVVAVGQKVDETLQAAEARLLGVLVLVRPGGVALEVAPGIGEVHAVKRNDQVLRVVHLGKRIDHTGLLTDAPGERFVSNTISAGIVA